MASEKQIAANRENATKAGVKTPEGKLAVKLNAVSHGIFSKEALLPGVGGSGREAASLEPGRNGVGGLLVVLDYQYAHKAFPEAQNARPSPPPRVLPP